MKLPVHMPIRPSGQQEQGAALAVAPEAIEPAGCCAQICTPLGCHCVAEAPFC